MKRAIPLFFTLILFFFYTILNAQYATVNFDLEKNYFNEGQPLPAEKNLMFTGIIPEGVSRIEIDIFAGKKVDYTAIWKKAFARENTNNFNLAVNYKLRPSDQYDFRVRFFQNMSYEQLNDLRDQLINQVAAYLVASVQQSGRNIQLLDREKKVIRRANEIVYNDLVGYRRSDDADFPGFSKAILQKLTGLDVSKVDTSFQIEALKEELYEQVEVEVEQFVAGEWTKLLFSRFIDDYETEKKQRSLSLNVGYGGIYLNGDFDDFSYGDAPFVGLLLPISSSVRAPKFFQNTSLNLGVFLSDFENVDGKNYSGFIIDQPLFAGLNFKLFQFLGLNAGMTLMEETDTAIPDDQDNENILFRPYVGLSAKFDIAIGLGK